MSRSLLVRAGDCEIDVGKRELRVAGRRRAVEPRVFSLLVYLAQRSDRVVTRQELLDGVWPGQPVSDAALARAVTKAREALGEAGGASPIRTVPKVGYRFVGVPAVEKPAAPAATRRVAILPFDNATEDAALDWVGLGLMSLVAGAIEREPGLATVAISTLLTVLDGARATGADPVASVQAATGAELIVRGQVTQRPSGYRLALQCLGLGSVEVEAETPGELGPAGARELAGLLRPGTDRPPVVLHEANPLATTAFARALQAQAQQRHAQAVNLLRMVELFSPGNTPVRLELLRAVCGMGDLAAARPIARGLLAEAQRRHDGLLTARVHMALGRAHFYAQAFEPATDHFEQSLYWLGDHGSPDEVAWALLQRAKIALFTGDHAACDLALEEMRRPCELSGDLLLSLSRGTFQAYLARARGDRERAADLTVQLLRNAHGLRLVRELMTAACNVAEDFVLLGRWSEAAAHAEQAFAAAVQSKCRISIGTAVVTGSWTYMMLGVPAAAQRLVEALPPDESLSSMEQLWAAGSRGFGAASAGRHAQAAAFLLEALRLLRARGNRLNEADVLPWLLRSLVHCGRFDVAEAELAATRPIAGAAVQGSLHHCDALLAHARGQHEQALQSLGLVMGDVHVAPLWRAWAVWDAAWLLAEACRAGEAQAMLERLPAGFDKLPLASAVAARVLFALGDVESARHCHKKYLAAASHGLVPPYLEELGECFRGARPISPVPCLPTRL